MAQHPLKLRRTDALLVLNTRPAILAQEHLLVTDVSCKAETDGRGRESENSAEVRRKNRKGEAEKTGAKRQNDRRGEDSGEGGGDRHEGRRQMCWQRGEGTRQGRWGGGIQARKKEKRQQGKTNPAAFPWGHRQVTPAFLFLCSTFLYVVCEAALSLGKLERRRIQANSALLS